MTDRGDNRWVIMRAGHPSWTYTPLPEEVRDMIGWTQASKEGNSRMAREIAFLKRGSGVVRVISMTASHDLLAREMALDNVITHALPSERYTFNFPEDLRAYLGLRTYAARKMATATPTRTKDCVAWLLRRREWDAYTNVTMEGGAFALKPGDDMHVYLTKAEFPEAAYKISEGEARGVREIAPAQVKPRLRS